MKFCLFDGGKLGVVRNGLVHDVSAALDDLPQRRYPFPLGDDLIRNLERMRERMEGLADNAPGLKPEGLALESPVANPGKIIGTPTNYAAHAQEAKEDAEIAVYMGSKRKTLDEQGLFLKANSALTGAGAGVALRFQERRTDHEAELGVVIGQEANNVSYEDALNYAAGYAIALDMVIRGSEDRSFRKSVDTYAVLGPWLVTAEEIENPDNLDFSLTIGGEVRQKSNTSKMIFDVAKQISWASSFYTLHPGDIIMTGTCEGVGPVQPGDVMELDFEGIGHMDVPVRTAD